MTQKVNPKSQRVYELARSYGIPSKELIEELHKYGISVKNHMSTLTLAQITEINNRRNPKAEIKNSEVDRKYSGKSKKKPKNIKSRSSETKIKQQTKVVEKPKVSEGVTVGQLASTLAIKGAELILRLMKLGIMASINQRLDYETLKSIEDKFQFEAVRQQTLEEKLLSDDYNGDENSTPEMIKRAPVVTIMGHVDHGKTSLLNAIKKTDRIETEAGNITQHIGAYHVKLEGGNIVFLDTPGHAAFTAMRSRGAKVTDIVILVVAANDGVQPQTVEAISHANVAEVPIVVAVNKIDVPGARPDHVKQQLAEHNLMPEEWGGKTVFVEVSAKQNIGIDNLLEMLLLEAEILELTSNKNRRARGTVVEAKLDRGRGAAATVLVQDGTLCVGDAFVAGIYSGKVRAMIDEHGRRIKEAIPVTPVEVLGFGGVPDAGDRFHVVPTEREAKELASIRQTKHRQSQMTPQSRVNLDDLFDRIKTGAIKELRVILKADVKGSLQAVSESLFKLSTNEVKVNIIHMAVGGITETDILLAVASNAIVIGFNIRPTTEALQAGDREKIDIRTYSIIYELIGDIKSAMEGLLDPEEREVAVGRAEVRDLFKVPRMGIIAGCYVNWGKMVNSYRLRVLRNNRLIYEGDIDSLRRFKDDVSEVYANYECGIGMSGYDDLKVGDILECFTHEKIARKLS